MKVNRKELINDLENHKKVINRKTIIPILTCVRFVAVGKGVLLSSTDLETSCMSTISSSSEPAVLSFMVEPTSLIKVLKTFPGDDVSVGENKEESLAVFQSENCEFKTPSLSINNFPALPNMGIKSPKNIKHDMVISSLNKIIPFASKDETRANINSVFLLNKNNSTELIATDGHRLGLLEIETPLFSSLDKALLPLKAVLKLQKILKSNNGDIVTGTSPDERHFITKVGKVSVSIRILKEDYVNYKRCIPLENNILLSVSKKEATDVMKRLSSLSTDKFLGGKIIYGGGKSVNIVSTDSEYGTIKQTMAVNNSGVKKKITISLNVRFILDYLRVVSGYTITLSLLDDRSPCLITCKDNLRAVIMPMKIM